MLYIVASSPVSDQDTVSVLSLDVFLYASCLSCHNLCYNNQKKETKKGEHMVDIEMLKHEIVDRLKPLDPDKIILFGSYAYGTPNEDSDIDLFLVKDDTSESKYDVQALLRLRSLVRQYHIGFDVLSASSDFLASREDYFYKVDILQKGQVLYGE